MKTLYVGIGGNGVKTLAAIKRKMDSYVQFAAARGHLIYNNDEFLFVDTDTNDIQNIPGFQEAEDFVSLNTTPATQHNHEKTHPSTDATRFFEWYDPKKTGLSASPLNTGAGAIRMDGRLGLYANKPNFMRLLNNKMNALFAAAGDANLRALPMNVYVFSGTSGGTGSGILLDVLMAIDKTYTSLYGDPNRTPSVTLFLFGPDQTYTIETDADAKMKKARNGAACLYELDAFKRCTIDNPLGSHKIFNCFSGWVDGLQLTSPFHFPKYVYYLDNTLAATGIATTQTVSYKVMHDLAADFVFNLEVGKLNKFNELAGKANVTGISQLDSLLVNGNQNNIDQNGYCEMFSTFAPLSVCFPKELFSCYCRTRFNIDCFKALRGSLTVTDLEGKKRTFKDTLDSKTNDLKTSIESIFKNAEKSKKTVADGISVNDTEHRIIYDNPKAPEFYKTMAPVVDQAKKAIEEWIFTHFANMLQTEGVAGVIEMVIECDKMLTSLSTELKGSVVAIPQPSIWQTPSAYFDDVLECIKKLIDIEIYDYCSLGNEGVLDHVTANLEALSGAFRVKTEECAKKQGEFIGSLNTEINNPMRQYLPRLDTIVRDNNFIAGNDFERTYEAAFTAQYTNHVRETVFAETQIQQDILDVVRLGDKDKATGVVVAMAKEVDGMFSQKFANDETITNYANTNILGTLTQKKTNGDDGYQKLIKGHVGAMIPTTDAILNDKGHMIMVLGNFQNNQNLKNDYLPNPEADVCIDDAFFADRVVSFYVTNGLCINDINSLNETYLPQLKIETSTHPAFSDKRFDVRPFLKDTIYEAMAGGSVELSKDLLALLMLCMLDLDAGRKDPYIAGTRVEGEIEYNGRRCKYFYIIYNTKRIELAFPTFRTGALTGTTMSDFTNASLTIDTGAVGKVYNTNESITQETIDCYNHILKGKGKFTLQRLTEACPRLESMLMIRLGDNVEYDSFETLVANDEVKDNPEGKIIAENIDLLIQ